MSKIEEQVINKIRSRAAVGKQKYGTTMERNDLTNAEWLKHLQEELMDAAVYAEKLLTLIDANEEGLQPDKDKNLIQNYCENYAWENSELENQNQ